MSSGALFWWDVYSRTIFESIEAVHGKAKPQLSAGSERRIANEAYVVSLCAHFQQFCGAIHAEAADGLVANVADFRQREILKAGLAMDRKLDQRNPQPDVLKSDFARLGIDDVWKALETDDKRNGRRKGRLRELMQARNAIAHGDHRRMRGVRVDLTQAKRWRSVCHCIATSLDRVLAEHVHQVTGSWPWTPRRRRP